MIKSLRRVPGRLALIAGLLATAACTGENLFTFGVATTALGPTLEITAPTAGFTIAVGDSVLISARANAPSGVTTVGYKGEYATSAAAYIAETENIAGGETAPEITNYLQASGGQVAGSVWIIVTLTDAVGGTATDSVSITVTN